MSRTPLSARHRKRLRPALVALALAAAPSGAAAQSSGGCIRAATLPTAVQAHLPAGSCAIAVERGDADGDGRGDYAVVLQRPGGGDVMGDDAPRALLLLLGTANGVRLALRADRAVLCPACGGVFGDPFDAVEVLPGEITVYHWGGAGWRWRMDVTFRPSARDGAWRLARVSHVSFHAGDPEKTLTRRVHYLPDDARSPALADFDAAAWAEKVP